MTKYKIYKPRVIKNPNGKFKLPYWARNAPIQFEKACLEVYKEEGLILKRIYLGTKSLIFGRSKECDEHLSHPSISRQHSALIHCAAKEAGGKYRRHVSNDDDDVRGIVLLDLYSSHHSYLNRKKIRPGQAYILYDKDIIQFGGSLRKYKVKGTKMKRPTKSKDEEFNENKMESDQKEKSKKSEKNIREHHSGHKRERDNDGHVMDAKNRALEALAKEKKKKKKARRQSQNDDHMGQVRVRHILVKHRKSRRPKSWKEDPVTRSKEEALEMIKTFRKQLKSGTVDFGTLAKEESHCGSHVKGGDLGWFGRKRMQKPFEEASFALEVGKISYPIQTDSGVHLIKRIG